MSETAGWKFRLAGPEDAESFTTWTLANPQIDSKDVEAAQKEKNPTTLYFAVENPAGQVVTFAPVYMQMLLAHLVFNPDTSADDRKTAMQLGLNGLVSFAVEMGIREIGMLSKEVYPVARWATKHGFAVDPRQFFKFDINRVLDLAEAEKQCAVQVDR